MRLYRNLGPVNIAPLLAVLPLLKFEEIQISTRNAEKCFGVLGDLPEVFTTFVNSLGLGGETRKLFIRRLKPFTGIYPHIDEMSAQVPDLRRFHVPLVSDPEVIMRWPDDEVQVHLEPGFVWEVNFTRMHQVLNPTACQRTHLQIDQIGATVEPL